MRKRYLQDGPKSEENTKYHNQKYSNCPADNHCRLSLAYM